MHNDGTFYKGKLGECSKALAQYLEIPDYNNPNIAFQSDDILYILFPNTGRLMMETSGDLYNLEDINKIAHECLSRWGGWDYVKWVVTEKYPETPIT